MINVIVNVESRQREGRKVSVDVAGNGENGQSRQRKGRKATHDSLSTSGFAFCAIIWMASRKYKTDESTGP